jgi:hypothetical protein
LVSGAIAFVASRGEVIHRLPIILLPATSREALSPPEETTVQETTVTSTAGNNGDIHRFHDLVPFFLGRPRGFNVYCNPIRSAIRFVHDASPSGWPRSKLRFNRSRSLATTGSFTNAAQFRGRSMRSSPISNGQIGGCHGWLLDHEWLLDGCNLFSVQFKSLD